MWFWKISNSDFPEHSRFLLAVVRKSALPRQRILLRSRTAVLGGAKAHQQAKSTREL
jgi:hypothetical protein